VTATRVIVVRHYLERHRTSNSGRLAHLALVNSEIVDHGGEGGLAKLPPLDGAVLLFPEGEPMTAPPAVAPTQVIALDATWSQARRMYRKLDALRGVPMVRLPDRGVDRERMRESPEPGHVSTLEAIAGALRCFGDAHAADALDALYALAVERTRMTGRLRRS